MVNVQLITLFFLQILFILPHGLPIISNTEAPPPPDESDIILSEDLTNCPKIIKTSSTTGHFHSPKYNKKYPNNSECKWIIKGPSKTKIKITFEEFELEGCCDYVYLYDGLDDNDINKIKRLSGKHSKGLTFSTKKTNAMTVKFTSDANFRYKGFNATFKAE